jgi:DNA-binding PadR family transcriptional regulator
MIQSMKLTPTSYIVLGLVEMAGRATPYDLKRMAAASIGNFWTVPHSQIYDEPARLAEAGLLDENREDGGRRRRVYSLTASGREALREWRGEATDELPELRDLSLLKLFFGADPGAIASAQRDAHERKLAAYEELVEAREASGAPPGPARTLRAGLAHERVWVDYWRDLE